MTLLALSSWPGFQTRHDFPLVPKALSPITELLFTTKVFQQLLHLHGCHDLLAIVTHIHHSWLGLLVEYLL